MKAKGPFPFILMFVGIILFLLLMITIRAGVPVPDLNETPELAHDYAKAESMIGPIEIGWRAVALVAVILGIGTCIVALFAVLRAIIWRKR